MNEDDEASVQRFLSAVEPLDVHRAAQRAGTEASPVAIDPSATTHGTTPAPVTATSHDTTTSHGSTPAPAATTSEGSTPAPATTTSKGTTAAPANGSHVSDVAA